MKYESTDIAGVYLLTPKVYLDFRGGNYEIFNTDCKELLHTLTKDNFEFVSDSISYSRKNTIRGLHGDKVTYKLITCLAGEIWFNVADVRPGSVTEGKTFSVCMGSNNMQQVLLPPGVVNGHLCLSESCVFSYKLSQKYTPQDQQISKHYTSNKLYWPIDPSNVILSQRDAAALKS